MKDLDELKAEQPDRVSSFLGNSKSPRLGAPTPISSIVSRRSSKLASACSPAASAERPRAKELSCGFREPPRARIVRIYDAAHAALRARTGIAGRSS